MNTPAQRQSSMARSMRIGILGSGVVGRTLARGLAHHGHVVRVGTRKGAVDDLAVGSPAEAVQDADLVFLAVLGTAAVEGAASVREELRGKILVDATNPLDLSSGSPSLFVGHTDSLGERAQGPFRTRTSSRPTTPSAAASWWIQTDGRTADHVHRWRLRPGQGQRHRAAPSHWMGCRRSRWHRDDAATSRPCA